MTEQTSTTHPLPVFDNDNDNDNDSSDGDENRCEYHELVDRFGALAAETVCEANDGKGDRVRWIRLEKQLDKSIESVKAKADVLQQMHKVAQEQSKYGNASLLPRRWKNLETNTLNGYALGERDDACFTVCQFNMLAEGLSAGPDAIRPFDVPQSSASRGQTEKMTYGGFTNVAFPEIALDFSLRRWRLLEVLLGNDGSAPFDVIALEEVDRFHGFFSPILRLFGYQGIFLPKTQSPSVRMGWYSDGCALFWKSAMFELVRKRRIEYKVGSQVLLLTILKHRTTGQMILFAVTHLKAQRSEANEMIRCAQVGELESQIRQEIATIVETYKIPTVPVLILGDFNADAPSQIEGSSSAIRNLLNSNISPSENIPCPLSSAYDVERADESFYTSWKIRGSTTTKRIIDYIFYGGNLSCQGHLAVPDPDDLGEAKLQSLRYPSDHMLIAAEFELRL